MQGPDLKKAPGSFGTRFVVLVVFLMATAIGFIDDEMSKTAIFARASTSAGAVFGAGLLMQALLPLIEKAFK